ncbi:MAG: hypothetical protein ACKV2V_07465 [Blastocatellia bacterium]
MINGIGIVKKLKTGDDITTRCGRCKTEREHVILSLKPDGAVERVQCRTCESNHLFRAPRATSTRTRTPRDKSGLSDADAGPAKPYSMQDRYRVGDRIAHPKFGDGLVVDLRSGKIDVKFGREMRVLIHAG